MYGAVAHGWPSGPRRHRRNTPNRSICATATGNFHQLGRHSYSAGSPAAPARRRRRLPHPDRAARAGTARRVPRQPDRAPGWPHRAPGHRPCSGPARPARRRLRHRRDPAHRRRGPPRAAAVRGRLGAPVRRSPDPGVLWQDQAAPPQPGRRPAGQPRPVADRDHPDELPPGDPGLRRPAYRPGPIQERGHALPQTLRRPRGLPPPPPRR